MTVIVGTGGHASVLADMLRAHGQHPHMVEPEKIGKPVGHYLNGIGDQKLRIEIWEMMKEAGCEIMSIKHPGSWISEPKTVGRGLQVMAGAVIQVNCEIGKNVIINTKASVDHDCFLGDHVFIGPGATLCGGVTVEPGTFIGAGAVIVPNMTVSGFVKAGSLVKE